MFLGRNSYQNKIDPTGVSYALGIAQLQLKLKEEKTNTVDFVD